MSDIRVVCGDPAYWNLLARRGVTMSTFNAQLVDSYLFDGLPSLPARFEVAGEDDYIEGDLNQIVNGTFGGNISSWTNLSNGTGNEATYQATPPGNASGGLQLDLDTAGSGNYASAYQDIVVRSGEELTLTFRLRGEGGGSPVSARLRVQNLQTGHFLNSSAAWTTAAADAGSQSAATWASFTRKFVVEPYGITTDTVYTCRERDTVTLRIQPIAVEASNTGTVYVDDVFMWPSWDVLSFHGHNLGPVTLEWRSSTDDFSSSNVLEATPTIYPTRFYHLLSTLKDKRYVKVLFVGTNDEAIELGEVVLAQTVNLGTRPTMGYEVGEFFDDIHNEGDGGDSFGRAKGKWSRLTFGLPFKWMAADGTTGEHHWVQARGEVMRRSLGRVHPLLLIPDTTKREVLHCKRDSSFKARRGVLDVYEDGDLVFVEQPFASRTLVDVRATPFPPIPDPPE